MNPNLAALAVWLGMASALAGMASHNRAESDDRASGVPEPAPGLERAQEGLISQEWGQQRTTTPHRMCMEPLDPFRRVAHRALRGDYGVIPDWKRDAYVWGLARGVEVCGVAKVTAYGYLWEPAWLAGGTTMASGKRVYVGACAANPELPFGCIVWTAAYGLARVEDRGGWVRVGFARVHGRMRRVTNSRETANLDYYSERPLPTVRNCAWARVKN